MFFWVLTVLERVGEEREGGNKRKKTKCLSSPVECLGKEEEEEEEEEEQCCLTRHCLVLL